MSEDTTPFPTAYFRQFIPEREELLRHIEQDALRNNIPIVGPVVGEFLYILATAISAEWILELGTATGYSTIFLGKAAQNSDAKVTTIESDPDLAEKARQNIEEAGLENHIELIRGDALEIVAGMKGPYDLIFLDIEKEDYVKVLPDCERLLRPGGLLLADNTAFNDADAFNRAISQNPGWRSVQLYSFLPLHSPEHDGLCIAMRR